MNKTELVAVVAESAGLTKKDSERVINAAIDAITASLVKGEKVQISGFGTFVVRNKEAHTGRNPKTNEIIQIPASRQVAFLPGKTLKEKINET